MRLLNPFQIYLGTEQVYLKDRISPVKGIISDQIFFYLETTSPYL